MKIKNIRNFCIIAHIDHGKSTLSDRIIQICNKKINNKKIQPQILDSMELEKEKGITIKSSVVSLFYKIKKKKKYQLNFIDTPGHVDFSYEVSRSLFACEGVLLLIDAKKGIESQTIAHYEKAKKMNLKILIVLNKIDLQNINYKNIFKQIKKKFKIQKKEIILCSSKTGYGIKNVIKNIIKKIPCPKGSSKKPLQALIIDSWFNNYLGTIALICIKNGTIKKGDKIKIINSNQIYNVEKIGIFTPKQKNSKKLTTGEVGWIICKIKNLYDMPVGETITNSTKPSNKKLKKFKKIKPQIYASLFPFKNNTFKTFEKSLAKLKLNDSSLFYELENSNILGFGFKCGFLGLLHMEIIIERLKREYNLNVIITPPTVTYKIKLKNKKTIYVNNPNNIPPKNKIKEFQIPIANCIILTPKKYLGKIISLCSEKKGSQVNIIYINGKVKLIYEIPLLEIVQNFFSQLKSISKGYASLEYYFLYFKKEKMTKINILINKKKIDHLSLITHHSKSIYKSQIIIQKIKKIIPRQQFDITIQAEIEGRIIASSKIQQLRKNVIAKCYGGDITRKKKLLEKQKIGKKKMKKIGNIKIPKEIFLNTFTTN